MAYIKKGDLLVSKLHGTKYIAESDDYIKRVPGTGEYLDDWKFVPAVDTLDPETGRRGFMYLREVSLVSQSAC